MAGSSPDEGGLIAGINVTPLVDITLVLLIIFMVTAKVVVTPAVPMDLPRATHASPEVQVVLSVILPAEGAILVNGRSVGTGRELSERARAEAAAHPELRAVIHADGRVPHWKVMRVLDALKGAGISRVAFATAPGSPEAP
jgi:biopolymer transport protein ExbD